MDWIRCDDFNIPVLPSNSNFLSKYIHILPRNIDVPLDTLLLIYAFFNTFIKIYSALLGNRLVRFKMDAWRAEKLLTVLYGVPPERGNRGVHRQFKLTWKIRGGEKRDLLKTWMRRGENNNWIFVWFNIWKKNLRNHFRSTKLHYYKIKFFLFFFDIDIYSFRFLNSEGWSEIPGCTSAIGRAAMLKSLCRKLTINFDNCIQN